MDINELSDIQSESGVIGSLIYHPEFISHTDYLKPNYFFGVENGCVFWAIKELFDSGITNIDAYNLSSKLQSNAAIIRTVEKYNLPSVQDFVELYKETARHTLEEYKMLADNIVTLSFKRDLVKTLHQVESECFNKTVDLEKLSSATYNSIDGLTQKYITSGEIQTVGDRIDEIWDEIEESAIHGIESKYKSFSKYFRYDQGELVIIQAKRKQGKSMFLLNETIHMLKQGLPTVVYDSEMNDRLYVTRLLSHLSGVNIHSISRKKYTQEEFEKIKKWKEWLKKQPFVHIYDPGMTMEKFFSICRALQNSMGLSFVVYDYLKSNKSDTGVNYNVLGKMTDDLKNEIAGKLNLPVLAACQLNRGGETADSGKINNSSSVGIKWGYKTQDMIAKDGLECGNAYAKIFFNRIGESMAEDDEDEYIDFFFDGSKAMIIEAEQHIKDSEF